MVVKEQESRSRRVNGGMAPAERKKVLLKQKSCSLEENKTESQESEQTSRKGKGRSPQTTVGGPQAIYKGRGPPQAKAGEAPQGNKQGQGAMYNIRIIHNVTYTYICKKS